MPFDALTLASVRQEIESKYVGGRVQGLLVPGPLAISLELYRGGSRRARLIMSAHPQHARIHLTGQAPTRDPAQQPPLLLLLRKYVRGGTLVGVSQPPNERVVALSIAKRIRTDKHQEYHFEDDFRHTSQADEEEEDPSAPIKVVDLVVEVMGRLSNIILVDEDGTVLDAVKRVPTGINRYRTVLPHQPYVAPPPQEKRDALHASINMLSLALSKVAEEDANAPAWKGLVSGFAGVSPALAREAAFRALGEVSARAAAVARQPAQLTNLLTALQALLLLEQTGAWQPSVAWRYKDGGRQPLDFAPYLLTHLQAGGASLEEYGAISHAATAYFEAAESFSGHTAIKAQVQAELDELRGRDERRLASLMEEWKRAQALEALRRKGEMLLAYMHDIQPGQQQLSIPGENLVIELEPMLTPVEQSQAIFKEYRKARSAHEELPARMEEAQTHLAYMDEMQTSLDLAGTYEEIRSVQAEVRQIRTPSSAPRENEPARAGGGKARKTQPRLPQPLRLRTRYGAPMLVGRTASQSDTATFRLADPGDLWLHARGVPGSHVILRTGQGYTEADLGEAASYAAGYSKARTEAQVDVIWTERKNVRRVPNAPPGLVTYRNERVVRVAPHVKGRDGQGQEQKERG